jgi:hypothetical protein
MVDNWKRLLTDLLKKLKIISEQWTGRITINVNDGNIGSIEKTERIK